MTRVVVPAFVALFTLCAIFFTPRYVVAQSAIKVPCVNTTMCNGTSGGPAGGWCDATDLVCKSCGAGVGCSIRGNSMEDQCPEDCCNWLHRDPTMVTTTTSTSTEPLGFFVGSPCVAQFPPDATLADVRPALVTLSDVSDKDAAIAKYAGADTRVPVADATISLSACSITSRSENQATLFVECRSYAQVVEDADCKSIVLVALVLSGDVSNSTATDVRLLVAKSFDATSSCSDFVLEGNALAAGVGVAVGVLVLLVVAGVLLVFLKRRRERQMMNVGHDDDGTGRGVHGDTEFTEIGVAADPDEADPEEDIGGTVEIPPETSRPDLYKLTPAERKAKLIEERKERRERFYAQRKQRAENLRGRRPYSGRKLKDPLRSGQSTFILEDEQEAVREGTSPELCDADFAAANDDNDQTGVSTGQPE